MLKMAYSMYVLQEVQYHIDDLDIMNIRFKILQRFWDASIVYYSNPGIHATITNTYYNLEETGDLFYIQ